MLVVQVVEILWTKATRGAPRSNERVHLPRAFLVQSGSSEYVFQHYRLAEWEAFAAKVVTLETKTAIPRTQGSLRISKDTTGRYTLGFLGIPNSGKPKRHAITEAIRLAPGEYGYLVVNARHSSYSGQFYSETVYNVASGDDIPSNRFLTATPDHELDLKVDLF